MMVAIFQERGSADGSPVNCKLWLCPIAPPRLQCLSLFAETYAAQHPFLGFPDGWTGDIGHSK
jgi:hypothetical protein